MKKLKALLPVLALTLSLTGAKAITFTNDTAIGAGNTAYDGQEVAVSGCTLTVDGVHSFATLVLAGGAVLTHSPAPAGETNNRLDLAIAGEMTIDATSRVDVNAKGYGSRAGPGAGNDAANASGGGHGGPGGNAFGAGGMSYGDLLVPTMWGSGGGNMDQTTPGGAGGGWVRLSVGGALIVAGQLTANGQSVLASGGAGGSIQVNAGTLAGSGIITANGGSAGNAGSGGGGGGRIALYYGSSTFNGGLTALGGFSTLANSGSAGTLYTKVNSQSVGDLLLDNTGRTNAMETPITSPVAYRLMLTNVTVSATNSLALTSLRVSANSVLTHPPAQLTGLVITVANDASIDAGGAISADRKGYGPVAGPGAGTNSGYYPSGGGHGGPGGNAYGGPTGGVSYGDPLAPTQCGSGGGNSMGFGTGGMGGGVIRLDVGGLLTVAGQLTANGESGRSSGGAGGSIQVSAGTLAGSGIITANGGSPGNAGCGGGGGGRIALYYGNSTFSGGLTALGGLATGAGNSGGAGTLYTRANSQSFGDLRLDNSGITNAMETPITSPVAYRLTLTNVTVYATNSLTLTGLRVSAGGLLTHPFQGPRLQVFVQGDAMVAGGGVIGAEGRGYPTHTGPGAGSGGIYWGSTGSGAGHGGQGGSSWSDAGGVAYDSAMEPVDYGSGGGGMGDRGPNRGGGAIQLTVAGTLTIDGRVSVNADAVTGSSDGGGAGGSVWLTASRLNGAGSITADGQAAGYPGSGAGGGGRIAIYTGVNEFAGAVAASGGEGGYRSGSSGSRHYGPNVPAGLISWWRGEGNTSDTMDVHPGTPLGGLSYAPGQIGQAFVLNGQNAAVALGNWFNLQEFTLSLWVKPDASQVQYADILDNNHTDYRSWAIQHDNVSDASRSSWHWGANGAGGIAYWMTNSTWQQLVVTVSSNHVSSLYRNGQLVQTVAGTGPITYDGTQFFNLGKHHLLGRYFNGLVDELMCFNRPLLPDEVASLYFNQGGPLQLSIQPAAGGVLLSWPAIATSYALVCRTNLTVGAWESVTNTPVLNGDRLEVLLPANTPIQRFFQLAQ